MRKIFHSRILKGAFSLFLAGWTLRVTAAQPLPYQQIGAGVQYVNERMSEIPWSIHIVKIDRRRHDLKFVTTKAQGKVYALSSIVDQIDSVPAERGHAVAAINGDFFSWRNKPYQGDPRGLQIVDGEMISAPCGEACFWMEGAKPKMGKVVSQCKVIWPDGTKLPIGLNEERGQAAAVLMTPALCESTRTTNGMELILEKDGEEWLPLRAGKMYSARVREISGTNTPLNPDVLVLSLGPDCPAPEIKEGMRLKISTATLPEVSRANMAIAGGPLLVHRGKPLPRPVVANEKSRAPRTAFGWNGSDYFFVVVDGRRKDVSDGMTFSELAKEMVSLGCQEAMNLDGGGSSTIWAGGKVLNQPSDNHIRSVANALICVQKK